MLSFYDYIFFALFYSSKSYEHTLGFKLRSSVPQTLWVSAVGQALGGMLETQGGIKLPRHVAKGGKHDAMNERLLMRKFSEPTWCVAPSTRLSAAKDIKTASA